MFTIKTTTESLFSADNAHPMFQRFRRVSPLGGLIAWRAPPSGRATKKAPDIRGKLSTDFDLVTLMEGSLVSTTQHGIPEPPIASSSQGVCLFRTLPAPQDRSLNCEAVLRAVKLPRKGSTCQQEKNHRNPYWASSQNNHVRGPVQTTISAAIIRDSRAIVVSGWRRHRLHQSGA